jgi:hypothetical protein
MPGGTTPGKDSEELVKDLAKKLDEKTRDSPVAFVTGGMAGVQNVFAESCGDGSKLWNLLPIGGMIMILISLELFYFRQALKI